MIKFIAGFIVGAILGIAIMCFLAVSEPKKNRKKNDI